MYALRSLVATALTLLIVLVVGLVGLHLKGAKLLSVQTASMLPTFRPGDALIVTKSSYLNLKPGEIVSYHSPRNPNIVITHRLIKIDKRSGWLTTQGDAYQRPHPSFPPSLVEGRATLLLPGLGLLLDALHKPFGLALAIYLPATVLALSEIRRLARSYTRSLYSVKL